MNWPTTLRIITWRDYNGVMHAFGQSKLHPNDWNPFCKGRASDFGSHDTERVMASIRNASIIPVEGPITCLICAAKFTR